RVAGQDLEAVAEVPGVVGRGQADAQLRRLEPQVVRDDGTCFDGDRGRLRGQAHAGREVDGDGSIAPGTQRQHIPAVWADAGQGGGPRRGERTVLGREHAEP